MAMVEEARFNLSEYREDFPAANPNIGRAYEAIGQHIENIFAYLDPR